ncbi:sulfur oxidation c-type cytochrome SoxX [Candidatus Sulfurimonas baltica]|uniref:Sulfur oxidation c-type cytochrome SoxX n=1 Tax=Candidatus Sulfurimonas baltica TaxID=2740404 RepID=A0A7S7LUY0_9BACT|nr:sulfur oxidation c-type cytochrome SoxX [Candidatus Sulfurimonas baltica]QOY51787.1 sulfur oxidation c-type cytochrome SoxX [Candidatus Sulfurimonas baltica]
MKKTIMVSLLVGASLLATDYSSVIESPNASKIIDSDLLAPATVYTMPAGCISTDKDAIARGAFIFHNLNGGKVKGDAPAGLSKKDEKGNNKQYGNCVACHNIEDAVGAGNIGPDLSNYNAMFMATNVRDNQFVYQKIADPRVDNATTHMTVNLTTKLFNEREICDITSYIVSPK